MNNYFYKNLYEILEISPTDDTAKIKSAYRSLARKYHPDLNGGNKHYEEKFKEITEACEILMDKDKKAMYDAFKGYAVKKRVNPDPQRAKRAYSQAKQTSTGANSTASSSSAKDFDNKKSSETKGAFSDVLNEILEGLFQEKQQKTRSSKSFENASASQNNNKPKNGTDIVSEVEISYQEALLGTHRTVNILHTELCSNCGGKMFINGAKCPLCGGSGETSIHKKINVKIPKGTKQNAKIRIAGEGNRGKFGGKNGDVYLIVKVKNDEKFRHDGLNVIFDVTIYPHEAVFGTELHVDTPQGGVLVKIPANTAQGQKFRLSEHGLKDDNGNIGDAIVVVKIDLPKELTDEELQLYKKLEEVSSQRRKKDKVK